MEIVLAFLLLIGVLTLDSNTTSHAKPVENEPSDNRSPKTLHEQATEYSQRPCRFAKGRLLQRDLTVPRDTTVTISHGITEKLEPEHADE